MKHKRLFDIVKYLTKQDDYTSIDAIASFLSVSNRTIRNDLDLLETQLKSTPIKLIRTPGMGIKLSGSHKDTLELVNHLNKQTPIAAIQSANQRRSAMILRLLSNKNTKISELMHEFYVSRATVQKDLVKIESIIQPFELTLYRQGSTGINIRGKERRMRNLMFEMMLEDPSIQILNNLLSENNEHTRGEYLFYGLDLTEDEIVHLIKIIEQKIPTLKQAYTPAFLSHLYIRLLIVLKRHEINQDVSLTEAFKAELMYYEGTYDVAHDLIDALEHYLKKALPEDETTYIQAYVIAYLPGATLALQDAESLEVFIEQLIQSWGQMLGMNFKQDTLLINGLEEHLNVVYLRVKHGIQISNPLLNDILEQYPHTFEVVQKSIEQSNDLFWGKLSTEEQGFLALYLASALERKKEPLKTLLVTDFGRSGQMILIQKIENHCREISILETIKIHDLPAYDLSIYDLILTTHDLHFQGHTPSIVIHNLLNDDALIQLKKAVRSLFNEKNDPKPKTPID